VRWLLILLVVAAQALAQTFIDLGSVTDKNGNELSVMRGPTMTLLALAEKDSEATANIGLTAAQVTALRGQLATAFQSKPMGKGKSAGFGSLSHGNSRTTVLITEGRLFLCVSEGKLDRYLQLDQPAYNKVQSVLAAASK